MALASLIEPMLAGPTTAAPGLVMFQSRRAADPAGAFPGRADL
ncbi:hypothetical protein ACSCBZ_23110 [Streptomyces niveiscabiei]|nr:MULTISPECIES: hypothetical protein [Streptomyces]